MDQSLIITLAIANAVNIVGTAFAVKQLLSFSHANKPHRHIVRMAFLFCWLTWALPGFNVASGVYLWWRMRQERIRNETPYVNTRLLFPKQFDNQRK